MSRLTTVTFDLWQTLLLDDRERGRERTQVRLEGTQKALKKLGEVYSLEHIREAYRSCYRQCRAIREENLDLDFREQVELFIGNISPGLVERLPEEIVQEILIAYSDSFFVHPALPHPEAFNVLSSARSNGLHVGLISNTGMTPGVAFRKFLAQHHLLDFFETLTFSDEVKLAKPGDEIFLLTLRELGAEPSESVHVGDHVKNDVVGANLVGMKTIWIEGFYEMPEGSGPEAKPDASVTQLGLVTDAIKNLQTR